MSGQVGGGLGPPGDLEFGQDAGDVVLDRFSPGRAPGRSGRWSGRRRPGPGCAPPEERGGPASRRGAGACPCAGGQSRGAGDGCRCPLIPRRPESSRRRWTAPSSSLSGVLHPVLFAQDHDRDLRECCTAGDRCVPLGSDGMWTKCGPNPRSCPDTTPRHGTKGSSSGTVPGSCA